MSEKNKITAKKNDDYFECVIECAPLENNLWELIINIEGKELRFVDYDCFSAFNLMRENLGRDYKFLCNASRKNISLSPMLSQSGGQAGYLVSLGTPPTRDDLVWIFDFAPEEEISTLEDQRNFKKAFIESFK